MLLLDFAAKRVFVTEDEVNLGSGAATVRSEPAERQKDQQLPRRPRGSSTNMMVLRYTQSAPVSSASAFRRDSLRRLVRELLRLDSDLRVGQELDVGSTAV